MKFTRKVNCPDEFAGDIPDVMVVEIDEAMAARIMMLAAEVKRLEVSVIQEFDYHAEWYYAKVDEDGDLLNEEGNKAEIYDHYYAPGKEFTGGLECQMLNVGDDDFWWSANLKGSSVLISCENTMVAELRDPDDYEPVVIGLNEKDE